MFINAIFEGEKVKHPTSKPEPQQAMDYNYPATTYGTNEPTNYHPYPTMSMSSSTHDSEGYVNGATSQVSPLIT